MTERNEQLIGTIDVRTLHEVNWPIFRLLARSFVERLELRRYKRELLSSGQWERIRAVPRKDRPHVYDLLGRPASRANPVATERVPYPLL